MTDITKQLPAASGITSITNTFQHWVTATGTLNTWIVQAHGLPIEVGVTDAETNAPEDGNKHLVVHPGDAPYTLKVKNTNAVFIRWYTGGDKPKAPGMSFMEAA